MKNLLVTTIGIISIILPQGAGNAITTSGDPNAPEYLVTPDRFTGVSRVSVSFPCTATLLTGGSYVLTAAHCIAGSGGVLNQSLIGNTRVTFEPTEGTFSIPVTNFFVHPNYNGDIIQGNDIAILELGNNAPANVEQYEIYRNSDEVGQIFTKVGYGQTGNGNEGAIFPGGAKRFGQNRYDSLGDLVIEPDNITPGSQLVFDFDNGNPANDAFGLHFGSRYADTGLGQAEVTIASGDSGSPGFIGNLIASIGSAISTDAGQFEDGEQADINNVTDSTFGEFAIETRVSNYQTFIDDVRGGRIAPVNSTPVPEPSSVLGLLTLGIFGAFSQLLRKQ